MGHERAHSGVEQREAIERGHGKNGSDDEGEFYPPSPVSSSPPRDFDVHPEGQYMPILNDDDDDDHERDDRHVHHYDDDDDDQSSLASSLSLEAAAAKNAGTISSTTTTTTGTATIAPSNSSRVIRCPVCEKPMRTFYCAKCILKGRFVTLEHNQQRTVENNLDNNSYNNLSSDTLTYCERKRMKPPHLSAEIINETTNTSISNSNNIIDHENKEKILEEETLQIKQRALKRKTEALKVLYRERQVKLEETRNINKQTRQLIEQEKKSYRAKESKIDLIKRFVASRKASVKKRHDAEAHYLEDLRQHVSRRVYQLTQDIFPIEELSLFEQNSSYVNMETSPLLTFSDGSHHQIEQTTAYTIVEPWLPSDGDYNAYSLWVQDNKDQMQAPLDDSPERNPAFRIGAALAYCTQLVKNLALYLDIMLPARLELDTFSRELLNDAEFSYNLAKLNTNVIHLCVSQGINISLLSSQRTLKNLLLLYNMNICDLGRKPMFELNDEEDDKIAAKIDSQLGKDLSLVRDDFYDFSKFASSNNGYGGGGGDNGNGDDDEDCDVSDSEWEISDTINPMELHLAEQSSIQQNSYISRPLRLFSSFWTASSGGSN